jgi:hypothetical protein
MSAHDLPPDCLRFRDLVEEQVIDDLFAAEDEAWMRQHTRTCNVCAAWQKALAVVAAPADIPVVGEPQIASLVAQARVAQTPRWLYAAAAVVVLVGAGLTTRALRPRDDVVEIGDRVEAIFTKGATYAVVSREPKHVQVSLREGSARFSVRHKEGEQVIVSTKQCDVIDEGTVFSVDAMADATHVTVVEGVVAVQGRSGLLLRRLGAGDSMIVPEVLTPPPPLPPAPPPADVLPEPEPTPKKARPPVVKPEPASLELLLHTAQEARMHQKWQDAAKAYRQVLSLHGNEPDAVVVLVSLAQIELKHLQQPEAALGHFKAYLARNRHGALAAEATFGCATAYRALGRLDDEKLALRELISNFPSDVNAQAAKERLDALQ